MGCKMVRVSPGAVLVWLPQSADELAQAVERLLVCLEPSERDANHTGVADKECQGSYEVLTRDQPAA